MTNKEHKLTCMRCASRTVNKDVIYCDECNETLRRQVEVATGRKERPK